MTILRNSLAKGNDEIRNAIKASRYDKAKTYDKIVTTIVESCTREISDVEVDKVLNPDEISIFNPRHSSLLKFDSGIFLSGSGDLSFTTQELEILADIQDVCLALIKLKGSFI